MLLFKFIICTQFFKLMLYFLFGAVLYLPMKLSHIKTRIINFIELLHASKIPTSPLDIIVPATLTEETTSVKPTNAETLIRPRPLTVCKAIVCGICENVTSEGGTIASPDYPDDYGNDRACIYIIQVPVDKKIQLTFTVFHVEFHYDWMDVIDGSSSAQVSTNVTQGTSLTGYTIPNARNSTSNVVTIHFASDIDNSQMPPGEPGRWQAVYKAIETVS